MSQFPRLVENWYAEYGEAYGVDDTEYTDELYLQDYGRVLTGIARAIKVGPDVATVNAEDIEALYALGAADLDLDATTRVQLIGANLENAEFLEQKLAALAMKGASEKLDEVVETLYVENLGSLQTAVKTTIATHKDQLQPFSADYDLPVEELPDEATAELRTALWHIVTKFAKRIEVYNAYYDGPAIRKIAERAYEYATAGWLIGYDRHNPGVFQKGSIIKARTVFESEDRLELAAQLALIGESIGYSKEADD